MNMTATEVQMRMDEWTRTGGARLKQIFSNWQREVIYAIWSRTEVYLRDEETQSQRMTDDGCPNEYFK